MHAQLGDIVAKIRKERGLSQADLAKKTKLSNNFIALFELNKRGISVNNLVQIADALNVPTFVLVALADKDESRPEWDKLHKQIKEESLKIIVKEAFSSYSSG